MKNLQKEYPDWKKLSAVDLLVLYADAQPGQDGVGFDPVAATFIRLEVKRREAKHQHLHDQFNDLADFATRILFEKIALCQKVASLEEQVKELTPRWMINLRKE